MEVYYAKDNEDIQLGHSGEHHARAIIFDLSKYIGDKGYWPIIDGEIVPLIGFSAYIKHRPSGKEDYEIVDTHTPVPVGVPWPGIAWVVSNTDTIQDELAGAIQYGEAVLYIRYGRIGSIGLDMEVARFRTVLHNDTFVSFVEDTESWLMGYLTGIRLHGSIRPSMIQPVVVASMSVTGIAANFDWFADLSGVETLTLLTADYIGDVTASYSYDGAKYTEAVPMEELLRVNPVTLFQGCSHTAPRLWFRFHLADEAADLTVFTLWGVFTRDLPWGG
ncbi:MAG: hypothetical protein IJQ25_03280 [Oscillibacter sp.]|nr:hypothetical protein [Oscillibacter sp.]